jgi:two-component sensor histidine kinase
MKRLLYAYALGLGLTASAQSFPLRNVNDQYFVSSIFQADISRNNFHDFLRDKNGLYWFQNMTEVYSFDGVNWKSYELRSINRSKNPFRINAMKATEDGNIWLGTEYGMYVYDPQTEYFISAKEKFPEIKNLPQAITCFEPAPANTLIFLSALNQGFYLLDLKSKKARQIIIDSTRKVRIPIDGWPVTVDKSGNLWGTTIDYIGVWNYNFSSGKVLCSWKGELPQFADKRFNSLASYSYSKAENALWISHSANRYVERMDMNTGKSLFFSFTENLKVHPDSNAVNRYNVWPVKIDKENNAWVRVGGKSLVQLNTDPNKIVYLSDDREMLPIGDFEIFLPEIGMKNDRNNILLWVQGVEKLSMIKKRGNVIKHIYFDTLSATGVKPNDYTNSNPRKPTFIFFEKGRNDNYFLLQPNPGKPKLISLDKDLRIKKALLNDQGKQYPAYFRREFDPDTCYIALLRPEAEPLDFRNVVLKDFRIDLNTLHVDEVILNFKQRIRRYGDADIHNVFWLFSNGSLYSYDPVKDLIDSIYICKPTEKRSSPSMIKEYNYPTVLHKYSSTFWISFFPSRQLYKVNLETKKIEKILTTCMDQKDCDIPGGVYGLYIFDSSHIYIKSSLSGLLLNTTTDSLVDYAQIFHKEMPVQTPCGSGLYREWICLAYPSHIYLLNTVTGKQKHLLLEEDFKWKLTSLGSKPLFTDRGELIFMSSGNNGFLVFNIDSTPLRKKPGSIYYSFIKVDNKNLSQDSLFKNKGLFLRYNNYNNIQLAFSDYSVFAAEKTGYEYALYKRGDTVWNKVIGKPELTITDLSPGKYQLLLRASNVFGDHSEEIRVLPIVILPPWWQTWWFRALMFLGISLIFYGIYMYRLQQLKKLQTIRNNIASDLHDDIGSTLNSISIYSEVAKQQAGKEIPALDLIGSNSRKIIESMSDIVWTINPENDSFEKIIVRMRSFTHQLLKAKKVEYTFEVDERLNSISLPMQVRKNFYLVFKEAITNLVKYSGATRVSISLYEENRTIMLKIKDNGIGIPVNPETQGNGLMNMKRRAEEIHADLNIISANGDGTGIELTLKT